MSGHRDVAITISDDDEDNSNVDVTNRNTISQSSSSMGEKIQPRSPSVTKQIQPCQDNKQISLHKTWVSPVKQGDSFLPTRQLILSQPDLDLSLKARPPKKRYTELPLVRQILSSPPASQVQHTVYQSNSAGQLQDEPIDLTKSVEEKPRSSYNPSIWDNIGGVEVQEIVPNPNSPAVPKMSSVPFTSRMSSSATILPPAKSNVNNCGNQSTQGHLSVPSVPTSSRSSQGMFCDSSCQPLVPQHGTLYYPSEGAYYPRSVSADYPTVMMHHIPQSQAQMMHHQPSIVVNAQQLSVVVNSGPSGQSTATPQQPPQQQNMPVSDKSDDCRKSFEISPRSSAFTQLHRTSYPHIATETQISHNPGTAIGQFQQGGAVPEKHKQQTSGKEYTTEPVSIKNDTIQITQVRTDASGYEKRSKISEAIEVKKHIDKVVQDRKSCGNNKPNGQLDNNSVSGSTSRVSTPDSVIIESVEGPNINYSIQQMGSRDDFQLGQSEDVNVAAAEEDKDHKQEESNGCNLTILETFSLRDYPGQVEAPVSASSETIPPSAPQPDLTSSSPENDDVETSAVDTGNSTPLVLESFSLQPQETSEDIKPGGACSLDYLSKKAFYQCCMGQCIFNTVSPSEFEVHLVNVHSEADVFLCVHCGHVAKTSDVLIQHMHEHVKDEHDRRALECNYPCCNFKSVKPDDLLRHIHMIHYGGVKHVCCKCDRVFENVLDLLMHIRSNFLSVVKCPHCSAKDVTKRNIIMHMNKSHPDKGKLVTVCRYIVCRARAMTNWPELPSSENQDQSAEDKASTTTTTPKKRYNKSFSQEGLGSPEMPNITGDCYPKASEDPVLMNTVLTPSSPRLNVSSSTKISREYIPIMSVKVASSGIEVEKIKSKAGRCESYPTNSDASPKEIPLKSSPSSSGMDRLLTKVKREPEDTGYALAIKQEPQESIVKQEPMDIDENRTQSVASGSAEAAVPQIKNLFLSPTSVSKERKRQLQRVNVCNKCDFYTSSNGAIYKHLHLVHKIHDMFQCSECLRFVCQEEVVEHHTKYHPNADENYVPTSMTHGFRVKYMQKSVYKSQAKDRRISKELNRDAAKSIDPVETVTSGLIERFSEAKEGEVVKLSSLESNTLDKMLRSKLLTSAAPVSTETEPVAKKAKISKRRKTRSNLTLGRKKRKRNQSGAAQGSRKKQKLDDTAKDVHVKNRKLLQDAEECQQSDEYEEDEEPTENCEEDSPEQPADSPEQPEENAVTGQPLIATDDTSHSTESIPEAAEETAMDFDEYTELSDNSPVATEENSQSKEDTEQSSLCHFDEYTELSDNSPVATEENSQTKEDTEQSNNSPCKNLEQEIETSRTENCAGRAESSHVASPHSPEHSENSSEAACDNVDRLGISIETDTTTDECDADVNDNLVRGSVPVAKQSLHESPIKEKKPKIISPKKSPGKKKSPKNKKSVGKTVQAVLTPDKTEAKDSKLKEPQEESEDASKSANNRTPVKETEVQIKSSPKDIVKLEPCTGPDLTFSQVNFDDPTYEFRCKYCTYRRGNLDKFLHHTYYHFHYRPYACGHCHFKGFSHNRVLTHIRMDHPKENNPLVKRVENANSEARCQKLAMICFIPKHVEDISLKIRLEKKKERAELKKALKKEKKENEVKIKKELKSQLKKLLKPQKIKTTVKKEPGKVKTSKKSPEGSYLCPYCRTNRPMRTWTKLVIEICYHIHYKPFTCSYCNELESASTLCIQKHIEKHHPKKEMVIKEQRDPTKEIRLKKLLQRSVDISKKHRQELKMKELKVNAKKLKQNEKKAAAFTRIKSETNTETPDTTVKREEDEPNTATGAARESAGPSPEADTLSPGDMTIKKSKQLFREAQDDYGVAVYECLKCDYTIRNLKSMYTHSYKHQPKIFKCAYCDYKSYPRSNVLWHQRKVHSHIKTSVINLAETSTES